MVSAWVAGALQGIEKGLAKRELQKKQDLKDYITLENLKLKRKTAGLEAFAKTEKIKQALSQKKARNALFTNLPLLDSLRERLGEEIKNLPRQAKMYESAKKQEEKLEDREEGFEALPTQKEVPISSEQAGRQAGQSARSIQTLKALQKQLKRKIQEDAIRGNVPGAATYVGKQIGETVSPQKTTLQKKYEELLPYMGHLDAYDKMAMANGMLHFSHDRKFGTINILNPLKIGPNAVRKIPLSQVMAERRTPIGPSYKGPVAGEKYDFGQGSKLENFTRKARKFLDPSAVAGMTNVSNSLMGRLASTETGIGIFGNIMRLIKKGGKQVPILRGFITNKEIEQASTGASAFVTELIRIFRASGKPLADEVKLIQQIFPPLLEGQTWLMNTEAILAKGAEVFEVLKGKWIMNLKLATREGQSVDKRLEYEDKALEIFHVMERMGNAPYVLKQYQNSLGGNLNPHQKFNRQLKILKRNEYKAINEQPIKDVNILREYTKGKKSLGKNQYLKVYNSSKQVNEIWVKKPRVIRPKDPNEKAKVVYEIQKF